MLVVTVWAGLFVPVPKIVTPAVSARHNCLMVFSFISIRMGVDGFITMLQQKMSLLVEFLSGLLNKTIDQLLVMSCHQK